MFPGDRRHLRSRHQALRGDLRLIRGRTIATPSRPRNNLKPTDAAPLRDVQLDVHFAVYNHTDTSLIRGQLRTLLSCFARGGRLSAYTSAPANPSAYYRDRRAMPFEGTRRPLVQSWARSGATLPSIGCPLC